MAHESAQALLETLRAIPLLRAAQLAELTADLAGRSPDRRVVTNDLVRRGWLTAYQAQHLLANQPRNLTFGPYHLLGILGEGGVGRVFQAWHAKMGRHVALKVVRTEARGDAELVARFLRESQAIARLAHPNVVHAFDAGVIDGVNFLAMEFVAGTDLNRLVRERGPLPFGQACAYVAQAALGLQHIHEHGLVHRDIKPGNLLLAAAARGRAGRVLILDLGLVGMHECAEVTALTRQDSGGLGTPDYQAPEQALDFHAADIRADIYSLGCTLFYLLTGRPPFPASSLAEKLLKHQQCAPPHLAEAGVAAPAGLDEVLQRALAKRPADRFGTPTAFAAALTAFCAAGQRPTPSPAPPVARRRRVVALLAAGVALAACGWAVVATVPFAGPEGDADAGRGTRPATAAQATSERLASGSTTGIATAGGTIQVNLAAFFNRQGLINDDARFSGGGLDGLGHALPARLLGGKVVWNGLPFALGAADANNVVAGTGQVIALPGGGYRSLHLLATAVNANQVNQRFVLRYADGSSQTYVQSISDWRSPQNYAGESKAVTVGYFNTNDGRRHNGNFAVYGYVFWLTAGKPLTGLEMPANSKVVVLAVNLVP